MTKHGFQQAETTPKLDLNWKTRLLESRNTGAGQTDRTSPFNDLTLQGGLDTNFTRGDFIVKTQAALLGSSREKEALRFSQLRNSAPKLDLSSYLVDVTRGNSRSRRGTLTMGPTAISCVTSPTVDSCFVKSSTIPSMSRSTP